MCAHVQPSLLGLGLFYGSAGLTDSESVLCRSDLSFYTWGMVISVRRSKTVQFSEREILIPVACVPNHELCAVHWVHRHFQQTKVGTSEATFQFPTPGGRGYRPLDYRTLQSTIKNFAGATGLDADSFSCHSLRRGRGGYTFLVLQVAPIDEIKVRGDWSSDCVYKYILSKRRRKVGILSPL